MAKAFTTAVTTIPSHLSPKDRMRRKLQTKRGRQRYALRMQTVEGIRPGCFNPLVTPARSAAYVAASDMSRGRGCQRSPDSLRALRVGDPT